MRRLNSPIWSLLATTSFATLWCVCSGCNQSTPPDTTEKSGSSPEQHDAEPKPRIATPASVLPTAAESTSSSSEQIAIPSESEQDSGKVAQFVGTSERKAEETAITAPESIGDMVVRLGNAVVFIAVRDALKETVSVGSGFFIDDLGHIVTNHHVIEDAVDVRITLKDGHFSANGTISD